jgi:hypothetical protein
MRQQLLLFHRRGHRQHTRRRDMVLWSSRCGFLHTTDGSLRPRCPGNDPGHNWSSRGVGHNLFDPLWRFCWSHIRIRRPFWPRFRPRHINIHGVSLVPPRLLHTFDRCFPATSIFLFFEASVKASALGTSQGPYDTPANSNTRFSRPPLGWPAMQTSCSGQV